MIASFRLRLALLSAVLTGVVLAAFGLGSWWLIRNIKIERLDSELRSAAQRLVMRNPHDTPWHPVEIRLSNDLGVRDVRRLLVLVQDGDATPLYQSGHWPAALNPIDLPWRDATPQPGQTSGFSLLSTAHAQESPPAGPRRRPGDEFLPPPHRPVRPPPGERPLPPPFASPFAPPFVPPHLRDGARSHPPRPALPASAPPPTEPLLTSDPPLAPSVTPTATAAPPASTMPLAPISSTAPAHPASATAVQTPRTASPLPAPPPPPQATTTQRNIDGAPWRFALTNTAVARVALGVDVRAIDDDMRGIRNGFLVALPFALVLIGLGSWWFASRALRPVQKLVSTTRTVTATGLDQRIDARGEDREFAELIEVFNGMLGRLQRSFQQAHRFTADAAHELKTPLAIVQGQLERAINQAEGRAIQTTLTSVLDEVRRLSVISRKLLLLSQADAGRLSIVCEPVDLSQMLEELLEDTRMLAPQLAVQADIAPALQLQADATLLRQVLHNLISNAIKYNLEGGWIRITTRRWGHRLEVKVANASSGIAMEDRARIFERFFRADPAHSRHIEGVGLGLSVSREIARAHGGDLTLAQEDTPGGVAFSLLLPIQ